MYSVIFVNDHLNQGSVYSAQLVREWAYTECTLIAPVVT